MTDHDRAIQRLSTEIPAYDDRIRGILERVPRVDEGQQTRVLEQLRVHPIRHESHDQIPEILNRIPGES